MKISIFCEGRMVDFDVADDKAAIFISSTKEYLKTDEYASSVYGHKKFTDEELAAMSTDELMKIAYGSTDYNSWHQFARHNSGEGLSSSEEYEHEHATNSINQKSPEEVLIEKEEQEAVRNYLSTILPESQVEIYYLREIEGWEFSEIAKYLDIPFTNVTHRFYRADKQIKKIKKSFSTPSNFRASSGYFSESKKIPKEK